MSQMHPAAEKSYVIVGAGPVGTELALTLAPHARTVKVVTRSGRGPSHPNIEVIPQDASDGAAFAALARQADVIFNCANPSNYTTWKTEWPPLAAALLAASSANGAPLISASNLYGYGRGAGVMGPQTPLNPTDAKGLIRAQMWLDMEYAHEQGRAQVAEARGSDYIGPTQTLNHGLIGMYAKSALAQKRVRVFADPDVPHTWTATTDMVKTLVALSENPQSWGKAWIVPSNEPLSVREVLTELTAAVGLAEPTFGSVPRWAVKVLGSVVPLVREVNGILYQFDEPFLVDSSTTEAALGIQPEPWEQLINETATAWLAEVQEAS